MKFDLESQELRAHALLLARSFKHFLKRPLLQIPRGTNILTAIYQAPQVIVSHGTEADPILNFGNQKALELWEMTWEELTATPSRCTAEAPNREERARLLAEVSERGYILNYSGVRISKSGRRFQITNAIVWNLLDEDGRYQGQAATFEKWEYCTPPQ